VEQASAPVKPNIIFIYTDDMGYGDAGCLNPDARFATPNIDRIADEGINFSDGHCSDTVCTPSRYGLLTGRYCWRTTKKTGVLAAEGAGLIADGRMTVASLLRDNGYATAMVGKWHLNMDIPGSKGGRSFAQPIADMPLDKGFDYFYGIPASMNYGYLAWIEGRHTAVNPTLWTKKKNNDLPGVFSDYRITPPYVAENIDGNNLEVAPDFDDVLCLTRFTDKAVEWMETRLPGAASGTPFFLYLPYTSSHKPVIPREDFRGLSGAGAYGDFMMETDHHVGRILDFLDDPDGDGDQADSIAGNTLVFFSSDNGPENTYTQRIATYGHDSAGPFRGGKRSIYEGGHRVPFLLRWPAVVAADGEWDQPVCQTDLLATLAEMLGVRLPDDAGEDSVSFYHVLLGNDSGLDRLPMVNHASDGQFAIRQGRWKLIMEHEGAPRELYDIGADPGETTDLLGDHPDIAARLEARVTAIVRAGRTTLGGAQSNDGNPWWNDLEWIPNP
jgi:arylsulfatase A